MDLELENHAGNRPHPVKWFAAGGLSVATLMGLFLYASGYFTDGVMAQAQAGEPSVIIEAKK